MLLGLNQDYEYYLFKFDVRYTLYVISTGNML